jgi:hypothetical protein
MCIWTWVQSHTTNKKIVMFRYRIVVLPENDDSVRLLQFENTDPVGDWQ